MSKTGSTIWAVAGVLAVIFMLGVVIVGGLSGIKAYSRYQQRADRNQSRSQRLLDEKNTIQVNRIRIAQTDQLVRVAEQKARIRYENAVGIRKAQDEIAKTLTPLYIQFEAIQAELAMAKSNNHTLMWIPSTSNAVPTVDPARQAGG